MTTQTLPSPTVNARSLLLPYLLGLAAAMVLVQTAIALAGEGSASSPGCSPPSPRLELPPGWR
ncbi:hypothetical protein OL239_12170 [Arthrobacter sp. ATA002]|uniref:hypothetical protein n=1 Tax=Arthrobacter sp. ATA002 TaxID=2991715 RepID=UPI0022A796E4|nr:hypothetical protein [Arthrobacter sp. ATA002]WAP50764.1 hypothetical protein OL239_12170 [Arthrobacter sp. ATA002]